TANHPGHGVEGVLIPLGVPADNGKAALGGSGGMRTLKLVVVEDERCCRELSNVVLAGACKFEATAVYVNASTVLEGIHELDADVAVLDIQIPGSINGFELGLHLKEAHPNMGIVFLSNDCKPALVEALQRRHLAGWAYLLKDSL